MRLDVVIFLHGDLEHELISLIKKESIKSFVIHLDRLEISAQHARSYSPRVRNTNNSLKICKVTKVASSVAKVFTPIGLLDRKFSGRWWFLSFRPDNICATKETP